MPARETTLLVKLQGITVVTFGNRDLCKAFCYGLARAGSHVAILYRRPEDKKNVTEIIEEIRKEFQDIKVEACQCDLGDADKLGETLKRIEGSNEFGGAKITGLITDADETVVQSALKLSHQDFLHVFENNFYDVYNISRAVAQLWEDNDRGGAIVIISSMSAQIVSQRATNKPVPQAFYYASKAAVRHLSRSLAAEWSSSIRVNTVSPGYLDTSENKESEETLRHQKDGVPLHRFGQPKDITGQVLLLLSPEFGGYMTGGDHVVDGGQLIW